MGLQDKRLTRRRAWFANAQCRLELSPRRSILPKPHIEFSSAVLAAAWVPFPQLGDRVRAPLVQALGDFRPGLRGDVFGGGLDRGAASRAADKYCRWG